MLLGTALILLFWFSLISWLLLLHPHSPCSLLPAPLLPALCSLLLSHLLEEAVCMLVGEDDLGLETLSLLEVHKAVAHNY